jgi:hypothetical protein
MAQAVVDPHAHSALDKAGTKVRGWRLTPEFDTYWRFTQARHEVYLARLPETPQSWRHDPILSGHRFTNCARAADRVSPYLIREVTYHGDQTWDEVFFGAVLFNLTSTSQLPSASEVPAWRHHRFDRFNGIRSVALNGGQRLYTAAFVIRPPRWGESRKHRNHLRLIEAMMSASAPARAADAGSLRELFGLLRLFPAFGRFLAYQFARDLHYAATLHFGEMQFVVPGPGARDGIRKCFGPAADGIEANIIRYVTDTLEQHYARLGLSLPLWEDDGYNSSTSRTCSAKSTSTPGSRTPTSPGSEAAPGSSNTTGTTRPGDRLVLPKVGHQRPAQTRTGPYGMISALPLDPKEHPMSVETPTGTDAAYADAVTVLATALDELGARIYRDVHVESSYLHLPEDSKLTDTLTEFSAYTDECLTVLDNPIVVRALAAARTQQQKA